MMAPVSAASDVRAQLAIPTELSILCGLAVGYPDPDFPVNKLHVGREPIGENLVFLDNGEREHQLDGNRCKVAINATRSASPTRKVNPSSPARHVDATRREAFDFE